MSDRARDNILSILEHQLINNNVSKISISEISKLSNISRTTFYTYFDTKESLISAFSDKKLMELQSILFGAKLLTFDEQGLRNILEAVDSYIKKNEKWLLMMHSFKFKWIIRHLEKKSLEEWTTPIYSWLHQAKEHKQIQVDDCQAMAIMMVTLAHEMYEGALLKRIPYSIDEVTQQLSNLFITLFFKSNKS